MLNINLLNKPGIQTENTKSNPVLNNDSEEYEKNIDVISKPSPNRSILWILSIFLLVILIIVFSVGVVALGFFKLL